MVPAEQLESASSRLFGTESAAQVAGPGLGGLLAQWLTAAAGIALAVAGAGGAIGVRETILVMAAVHCLACWGVLLSPLARMRELPTGRLGDQPSRSAAVRLPRGPVGPRPRR